MYFSSEYDDPMQLTLRTLDGRRLAAKLMTFFFIYFCNAEFDRSAHTGIGENWKLLGDNKRTTPTPEVERPVYTTVDGPVNLTLTYGIDMVEIHEYPVEGEIRLRIYCLATCAWQFRSGARYELSVVFCPLIK